MLKIGFMGLGGISKTVIESLSTSSCSYSIVGALVRPESIKKQAHNEIPLFDNLEDLLAQKPDVIAECASHSAVEQYSEDILRNGVKLVLISIGALANNELYNRLKSAAKEGSTSLLLPAGAIGGIDALSAAKISGLHYVSYRARKPSKAWKGTPAEQQFDLDNLSKAECIFQGTAREAALLYPKNSNVAATVALAGSGFDKTHVELIVDPNITENCHEIEVQANSGTFSISLSGQTLPNSTKTSALAAYSVAKCLVNVNAAIVI